jgi:ABC-2 type transport system permease protein
MTGGRVATAAVAQTRLLVLGGYLSYRALFAWLRPSLFIPTMLIGPLLQTAFFVVLGRYAHVADDRFYIGGNALLACAVPCVYGPMLALAEERSGGTLPMVLASPVNRITVFLGRMIPFMLNGLLVSLATLLLSDLLYGSAITPARIPALLPVLLVSAASCSGLGLLLGALGLWLRDVPFLSNLVVTFMLLVTGANVARAQLPPVLRAIGDVVPLTRGITAIRDIATGGSLGASAGLIGGEALVGAVYLVAAVLLVRWIEGMARRAGTLALR